MRNIVTLIYFSPTVIVAVLGTKKNKKNQINDAVLSSIAKLSEYSKRTKRGDVKCCTPDLFIFLFFYFIGAQKMYSIMVPFDERG